MCEPSKRKALVIPDQNKFGVLMKNYYEGFSNFWTGRQYVLEYEEVDHSEHDVETTGILEYEEITG